MPARPATQSPTSCSARVGSGGCSWIRIDRAVPVAAGAADGALQWATLSLAHWVPTVGLRA
jgi:hypothetical protein